MALPFGAEPSAFIPTLWAAKLKAKAVSRQAARNNFAKFLIVFYILRFNSFKKGSPFWKGETFNIK
jgi:hypothetical protein